MKILDWFKPKKLKHERRYEEEKREFEMAMGKPFVEIKIELPEGLEDQRTKFLSLEKDEQFLEEVRDLIRKRLTYERHGVKQPS